MPTPEDQLFLHFAVKYRWLDESVARGISRRLEDLERQGAASTAETLCAEQGLLKPNRQKVLHDEVHEAMVAAGAATEAPPGAAAPAPAPAAPAPAAPARPASSSPDEPIPGYRIVGKLGTGGMATVFRAVAVAAGQPVALKILLPTQAKIALSRDRFVREAQLLTLFDHPNIVKGHQSGLHNGLYFLAMELIDGLSVQDTLDKLRQRADATGNASGSVFEEDLALEIILQSARALAYLQEHGVVHRDVKPGNIMLTRDGAVKLLDLGFAQPIAGGLAAQGEADVTCGTPEYMSPEQARGQHDVDIRSDIYALGATLYHMVLGEVPFKGTDSLDVMAKQVLAELYSPRVKERLSRHMHYFIEKMMAKEKDVRYQSPKELVEDIGAQIVGFRSLQFKRTGPPPDPVARLQALVAPFLPPLPRPGGSTTQRIPRPSTGTTGVFTRPGTRPGTQPGTQRIRRFP
jgi:serine/threonine-protein kinase